MPSRASNLFKMDFANIVYLDIDNYDDEETDNLKAAGE